MSAAGTARHLECRPGIVSWAGDAAEAQFAKDRWDAFVLGIAARRGRNTASFTTIEQEWCDSGPGAVACRTGLELGADRWLPVEGEPVRTSV